MKTKMLLRGTFAALLLCGAALLWWRNGGDHKGMPGEPLPTAARAAPVPHTAGATLPPLSGPSQPTPRAHVALPAAGTALDQFDAWAQRFLGASPEEKAALEAEGARLAAARRPMFKQLIQSDPREALERAIPMVVRQSLPPAILSQLEERIADRGEMRLYGSSPDSVENGQPNFLRYVETRGGRTYEAHVFGRRETVMRQLPDISINGVAIDGELAVSESPLRRLEVGEIPNPARPTVETCPVSGKTTALEIPPATPIAPQVTAVEVYDQIVYLCDGAHIVPYEQTLIMGEAGTGGAQSFTGPMPAASVPSVGVVKILYVPAVFADQGQVPASEATCHDVLRQVADFYQTQSFGRLTLIATVTPPVKLPRNQAWYKGKDTTDGFIKEVDGLGAEMIHAKEAARAMGYDWQDYHCFVVRANGGARAPTSFGSIGAGQVWMRNDSVSTVAHEVGHAFGLTHANFWLTNGASVAGPGGNEEYGDIYDNMGSASPPSAHYNAQAKNQVKWLPDEFAPPITQSGQYRVYAFDTPRIEPGKLYGLRLIKDAERTYWGEFRTLFTGNNWVSNGLLLGWKWSQNNGSNIQLLDTTPGSINGKNDAPIGPGATFSDFEAGIHITTLAVNPASSPPSVDVQVHLGDFAGNQPPVLTLTPAAPVVPTNSPVSFTATASDPDGDPLAYSWRWHDSTISPNSPTVSRTFTTSGIYTLSCVVSDMKGGIAVRNAVITVGTGGSRFTISGRVTRNGAGMAGINVTTSGTNGTLTDSDGYYTVSNLTAATYTITPAGHGYQFNELFNNSITVGPSFSGANFEVDDLPAVTLTAPAPTAIEGSSPTPGTFRLTRTGPTGLPLTVSTLVVRGTATKTNDYTFAPDYAAISGTPYFTFTIPADQAFLDITVTPVNDGTSEGDETVQLILGMDAAYLNGTPAAAVMTIRDDDTALPRVSLSASHQQVSENSGGTIVCTLKRAGSTTGDLAVTYTLPTTNTATSGSDYATLSGTATIPSGSETTTFVVTPIDDAEAEATERLTITISTTGSYIADSAAASVNLRVVDDDTQVVSLSTQDSAAAEVDRSAPGAVPNPGTFVVSRTGDTSQPLTVYYAVAGSALHGVDYDTLAGSLVLVAGQTQGAITIMPRPDSFGEAPETVILSLAAGNEGYQLGGESSGTVTISDSGGKPLLEVMASSAIAAEPGSNGTFRITAKGTGTNTITVNYTVSGTAAPGSDYTALTGSATITLNNGIATQDVPVPILNDSELEEIETVILTLTPSADYTLWEATQSATLLLRDDDQPTVFADPQVAIGNTNVVAENSTATACKFWISRTGSTAAALTVNYSLVGTATNGTDHTTLSGAAVIPVDAPGVDVIFSTINDLAFEGTETVILRLEPGAYARGPDATLYITDDDSGNQAVAFTTPGGSGSEDTTAVNIPVTLTSPATSPVTVEYALETGARTPTLLHGNWVRVVRTGTSFQTFTSADGVGWTSAGTTRTINMSSANYLVGIAVTSGTNGTSNAVQIDNVSLTSLSGGGTAGALAGVNLGALNPVGAQVETSGLFQVFGGGPDISSNSTTDACRFVYFPVSNSSNCTMTARVLSHSSGGTFCRAGVMIRETTAANSMHFSMLSGNSGAMNQVHRTANGGNAVTQSVGSVLGLSKPGWLRITRVGNVFTAFTSGNGTFFTRISQPQTIPLSAQVLVGLGISSRSDGTLAQAGFDNITLDAASVELQGRNIGFVNESGSLTIASGTHTLTGSGTGFLPSQTSTEDEGYMAGIPVSGDFTFTARLVSFTSGPSSSQAGLVVRESANHRARSVSIMGNAANSTLEFRGRFSSTTSGEGFGVDYRLDPGILNFGIGDLTKNIVLNVTNDLLPESVEFLTVALKYPNGAMLGPQNTHTFAIVDDDSEATVLPAVGFAGALSQASEAGTHAIPVVLSSPSVSEVTVDYDLTSATVTGPGVDYEFSSGTLTFAPGESFKTIPVQMVDDSISEGVETFTVTLSNPVSAVLSTTTAHTVSIQDDDFPVVTIVATDPAANESGDTAIFTLSRTGDLTNSLAVVFSRTGTATSGIDFTPLPASPITFPAGQATVTLTVSPIQNTTPESPETVIVTLPGGSLSYSVGTPASATATIHDDDVNTVSITASDPMASEAGSDPGQFTLTRAGPTVSSLTVTISITGTATGGSDYTPITTSRIFAIGQSAMTIPVTVIQDVLTEGNEEVVVSIATSANYLTGSPAVANVTIVDDDLPPSVFVSSPASKSTIIGAANGLMLEAAGSDDGLPNPLAYQWSQLFGPGAVTFGDSSSSATTAAFSAPGVYGLRISVDDGQFTATDDIIVQAGGFSFGNWVGIDQGPPGVRGISGESSGVFTLIGSGIGYSTSADSGHMMFRQLIGSGGDCTIVARLASLTGPSTRLAGITVRDTSWKGAKRANLLMDASGTLQFRQRASANSTDTSSIASGVGAPRWLKLVRSGGTITASHADDAGGAPGSWTEVGTASIAMNPNVVVGMVVSAGAAGNATTTAVFDHVTVTPEVTGSALHSEDLGNYTLPGDSSEAGGVVTINAVGSHDGTGSHFRYQQIWGDCMVTARLTSHSGTTRGAQSGVALRDTTDNGPFGFFGTTTIDGFQAHWRSSAGGGSGTLQTGGSVGNWIRLIRKGNNVSAFRAANVGSAPGSWTQVTGNLPAPMTGPMLVGLLVDSNSSSLVGTGTFTGLQIEPLNVAPVITIAAVVDLAPFALQGAVADDGKPAPPGATAVEWSQLAGPAPVVFGNALSASTVASLSQSGAYAVRLTASDGEAQTFAQASFNAYLTRYAKWQDQQFVNGLTNPHAGLLSDPDFDGLTNLEEYAMITGPNAASASPITRDVAMVGPDRFLRLTVPKNPNAPELVYEVEATSDLTNPNSWSSAGLIVEQNDGATLRVRDSVPMTGGARRFMRVWVSLP